MVPQAIEWFAEGGARRRRQPPTRDILLMCELRSRCSSRWTRRRGRWPSAPRAPGRCRRLPELLPRAVDRLAGQCRHEGSILIRRLVYIAFNFLEVALLLPVLPWSSFWDRGYYAETWPGLRPPFLTRCASCVAP